MIQKNPHHNPNWKPPAGYTDVGWSNAWKWSLVDGKVVINYPAPVQACMDASHKKREVDNSWRLYGGTNIITICDECRICWHTDMSD